MKILAYFKSCSLLLFVLFLCEGLINFIKKIETTVRKQIIFYKIFRNTLEIQCFDKGKFIVNLKNCVKKTIELSRTINLIKSKK